MTFDIREYLFKGAYGTIASGTVGLGVKWECEDAANATITKRGGYKKRQDLTATVQQMLDDIATDIGNDKGIH